MLFMIITLFNQTSEYVFYQIIDVTYRQSHMKQQIQKKSKNLSTSEKPQTDIIIRDLTFLMKNWEIYV